MKSLLALALLALACHPGPRSVQPPAPPSPVPALAAPSAVPSAGEQAIEQYFAPLLARCETGDRGACSRLAQRLHFVTNNREARRVIAALAKGCGAKSTTACGGHGLAVARGLGGAEPAVAAGLAELQAACTSDDAFSCAELSEIYLRSELGISGRVDEGKRLAGQSCDKLGGWPCYTVATTLDQTGGLARVVALSRRACDGGDLSACYELGMLYAEGGSGVAADPKTATTLYQTACDGDLAPACFNLGWQYLRGTGAPKDERRGHELVDHACTLGDGSACDELARTDGHADAACERWGVQACFDTAAERAQREGETAASAEAILTASTRACRRGHVGACNVLGHLAKDYLRRCDAGSNVKDTCMFAGLLYARGLDLPRLNGTSVPVDPARAAAAFRKSCDQGAAAACRVLRGN